MYSKDITLNDMTLNTYRETLCSIIDEPDYGVWRVNVQPVESLYFYGSNQGSNCSIFFCAARACTGERKICQLLVNPSASAIRFEENTPLKKHSKLHCRCARTLNRILPLCARTLISSRIVPLCTLD